MMWISSFTTSQRCLIGLTSDDCKGHPSTDNSLPRYQFERIWASWHDVLCEAAIRRWICSDHKGIDMVNNSIQIVCDIVPRKHPQHHNATSSSLKHWYNAQWIPHVVFDHFWPYHPKCCSRYRFIRPGNMSPHFLLSNFGKPVWNVASVSMS